MSECPILEKNQVLFRLFHYIYFDYFKLLGSNFACAPQASMVVWCVTCNTRYTRHEQMCWVQKCAWWLDDCAYSHQLKPLILLFHLSAHISCERKVLFLAQNYGYIAIFREPHRGIHIVIIAHTKLEKGADFCKSCIIFSLTLCVSVSVSPSFNAWFRLQCQPISAIIYETSQVLRVKMHNS